jgi:hypothetical protein
MTLPRRVSRRSLLKLMGFGTLALAGGAYAHAPSPNRLLAARLRSLVPHSAAAAVLGAAYLEREPGEASTESLVTELVPARVRLGAALTSDERLGALLARSIRADFAAGRTVVLRGWIVSATEGRLAALTLTA